MQASNATLTVNEAIAGRGRISATDQFTAQILRNGTLSNSANSSTTLGTGTQVNPGSGTTGPTTVTAGNTYTVTQVMAPPSTSALGDYTASMSCVSALGRTNLAGVSAPGASITPGTGDVVSCTITNQAACTPPSVNTTLVASLSATDARSGQARSYSVFTTDTPQAGYVQAFPLSDKGVVSNTASWDAAQLMQTQLTRTASTLYSTTSDGLVKNLQGLARDEPGVFSLAASSCVPDVNALLNVIVNPTAASTSTCNFLGNRKAGWPLASFSARSATAWAGPPGNPALLGVTGYLSYAKDQAARSMLLFTNNDGFLYAINANTGALMWGWTPRAVLGTLQNYVDLPTRQIMNGNVKLVDSLVNGAWASFVVGSLQSGAEHFSLRLDRAGMPVSVTADAVVSGGLAPEGLPGAVGSVPTHQTPQTLTIQGVSYYTYVITSGGTSTVYEMNVGTGVVSSATLPFVVSSSVYLDQNSSMLWMGSSTGSIYGMVINGNATDDIQRLSKFITVNNPASNSPISKPIINVYSTTLAGTPYLVTNTSDTIAVYTTGTNGWIGKWASTPLSGYSYSSASGAFNSDSSVTPLAASSVISDSIRVDGNTVLVPLDQAAASFCVLDTGYLMLLNLVDGKNNAATYKYGADAASQLLKLGAGPAHTPAITRTIGGLSLNPSTQGCPPGGANCSTNQLTRPEAKTSTSVIGWRNR